MKHIFLICTVLVLLVNTTVLSQTILFQENFNYTPGQLTTVSGGNWGVNGNFGSLKIKTTAEWQQEKENVECRTLNFE